MCFQFVSGVVSDITMKQEKFLEVIGGSLESR